MTATEQRIRRISIAALGVPFACVAISLAYAFRAKLALGYWPAYDHPDPKQLG